MTKIMTTVTALLGGLIAAAGALGNGYDSQKTAGLEQRVKIETTLGDIVLSLDTEKAPLTVINFIQYVEDKFYGSTVFHRVLSDGLIQGGAYTPDMKKKSEGLHAGIKNESDNGLKNLRGAIAMYRVPDRPRSLTAQFYINVGDNTGLDQKLRDGASYTVFGRVVDGMDTVDKIARTPVGTHPRYAAGCSPVVPIEPVIIKSIKLLAPFDRAKAQAIADEAERRIRQQAREAGEAVEEALRARIREIEKEANAEMITTESGLKYVDLRVGRGAPPIGEETVMVNYRATRIDGTEFENTFTKEPIKKQVRRFIAGVREGLLSMNEGGKRIMIVPPELAFKKTGIPGTVPPNTPIVFEIELLAIE